jgi:hypothetical protein
MFILLDVENIRYFHVYDAMQSSSFSPTAWRKLLPPFSRSVSEIKQGTINQLCLLFNRKSEGMFLRTITEFFGHSPSSSILKDKRE